MENQNTRTAYGGQQKQSGGMGLPQCPHCGKRVNPFLAWGIKSKGEFECSKCGSYSNIRLAKGLYIAGLSAVILAGILLLVFLFTGCMNLALLIFMLVPFAVFTVISPFFVRLQKIELPGQKRKTPPAKKPPVQPPAARPQQSQRSGGGRRYSEQFSLEQDRTTQFRKQDGGSSRNSFDR